GLRPPGRHPPRPVIRAFYVVVARTLFQKERGSGYAPDVPRVRDAHRSARCSLLGSRRPKLEGRVKKIRAEYIWIDGQKPTAKLRSKTKIVNGPVKNLEGLPDWGFDGSSTSQAEGHFSDCQLKPVKMVTDPIHDEDDVLVLCEVLNADGSVHPSN